MTTFALLGRPFVLLGFACGDSTSPPPTPRALEIVEGDGQQARPGEPSPATLRFLNDIYVSRRDDTHDDLDWEAPVRLGPDVNAAAFESGPSYRESAEDGPANLYFYGGTDNNTGADIYYAAVSRDGETRGPATLVSELSVPNIPDGFPSVRADGREIFFNSGRGGVFDLWGSTRRSVHDGGPHQ